MRALAWVEFNSPRPLAISLASPFVGYKPRRMGVKSIAAALRASVKGRLSCRISTMVVLPICNRMVEGSIPLSGPSPKRQ